MRLAPLAILLVACTIDSNLNEKPDDPYFDPGDTSTPFDTDTDDTDPPPVEECNGYDDDGDGLVDEDFEDLDGNGRADCLDTTCPALDLGTAGAVTQNEECQGTTGGGGPEVTDPWAVRTQWTYRGKQNSWMTPVIGNLDDDNGDGVVDENDIPEVVISADNSIVALDGATGAEKWTYPGYSYGGVIIADIDADGWPDVVGANSSGRSIALEGDGTPKWTANDMLASLNYVLHNVADLDNDGVPEVIHDTKVLSGVDGTELFEMTTTNGGGWTYRLPAIGDVDLDGDQEIALEGALYDSDGSLIWDSGEIGTYGFWPILIQADSDPEAEIGFVGQYWTLWDHDGTLIYRESYNSTAQPGPPCAGDFDGDGEAEVAWPAYQSFVMYELDGSRVWSVNMDDTSGLAGCSGYDLNNDGALEILFADQSTFTIFDGATGAELFVDTHASPTIFEYPTVADIDADGHAEIVVAHYGMGFAVTAYEHDGDGWPAAGTTWNVHDFAITNINPDGSVPRDPDPSWLKYNVYRARVAADDPSTPDLAVSITDVCVADCAYGPVALAAQVRNEGGADVEAGATLTIYAEDNAGPRAIATYSLPAVPAGTAIDGIEFTLTPADIGERGFSAEVDAAGTVSECVEDNNTDEWRDVFCP